MILNFMDSVEFYVICVIVAAAIVSLFIRPQSKGEVTQHLVGSYLTNSSSPQATATESDAASSPEIELTVNDDLTVTLVRHGLKNINSDGAVSLVVTLVGNGITIEERLTPGHYVMQPMDSAVFKLDFLAPRQYHLRYTSQADGGIFAATPLSMRPGIHIRKPLA